MAVRMVYKSVVLNTIENMYNRASKKEDYRDLLIECVKVLPEPEAIPIKWLKEKIGEFYDDGYEDRVKALRFIIAEWRRENGKTN